MTTCYLCDEPALVRERGIPLCAKHATPNRADPGGESIPRAYGDGIEVERRPATVVMARDYAAGAQGAKTPEQVVRELSRMAVAAAFTRGFTRNSSRRTKA